MGWRILPAKMPELEGKLPLPHPSQSNPGGERGLGFCSITILPLKRKERRVLGRVGLCLYHLPGLDQVKVECPLHHTWNVICAAWLKSPFFILRSPPPPRTSYVYSCLIEGAVLICNGVWKRSPLECAEKLKFGPKLLLFACPFSNKVTIFCRELEQRENAELPICFLI